MHDPDAGRQAQKGYSSELALIRESFVNRLWGGLALVALLAAPISLARIPLTGWLPLYGIHLALAVVSLLVLAFRRRIPMRFKSALFIAMLWSVGLPGVLSLGLATASVHWLVLSCLVASTLYSPRIGALFGAATMLALMVVGLAFIRGWLTVGVDLNAYLVDPAAWGTLVLASGAFVAITLFAYSAYTRSTVRLVERISEENEQIEFEAMHDMLTGLPLARLAEDRLQMAIAAARREGHQVAVMGIDLDGFKQVNDSHGHAAGNAALREVARRMASELRGRDTVARMGGDEFLAVVTALDKQETVERLAQRLVASVGEPVPWQGFSLQVGASIGIAMYPRDGEDAPTLIQRADQAMYEAKRLGGRRYLYWQAASPGTAGSASSKPSAGDAG